jgi:integrase
MAWLYKQKESDNWWIGYRLNGKQYRYSTKTDDRSKAEKILATFRIQAEAAGAQVLTEDFYRALTGKTLPNATLVTAMGDWLNEAKGSTAPNTFERYSDVSRQFIAHLKADDTQPQLSRVDSAQVQGYLDFVRSTRSVGTTNLYLRILTGFFNRCTDRQLIKFNPCSPVKRYKVGRAEKVQRRAFTLAEVKLMLEKAPDDFWKYMVMGGFFTGLRMGDLISLTWGNVDLEAKFIRLVTIKTGTRISIPIRNAHFLGLLVRHKRAAGKVKQTDPLWPEQATHYASEGAGCFSNEFYDDVLLPAGLVPERSRKKRKNGRDGARTANQVSFHSLRHTFVSMLKITGANQSTAKELAGHSSDQVNELYTHLPETALVDAISALPDPTK